jgi:hypothetical protein
LPFPLDKHDALAHTSRAALQFLILAVILSAAKDPEGIHSLTAFRLFPTRFSTVVSTIHPINCHFDRSPSRFCAQQGEEIRFPIRPPHDEQKALAATS